MRKTVLRIGVLLAVILGVQLAGGQTSVHADTTAPIWPTENLTQNGNSARSGNWGTASDSDIAWTFDSGGDTLFTEVTVVDNIAYVGSMGNKIYALNATTGQHLWTFTANNWIMTNAVVKDGILFAGSGNREFNTSESHGHVVYSNIRGTGPSSLYGINAKTGQKLWEYPVQGEAMPTPIYKDGIVYFVTGDHHVYGLEATTGKAVMIIGTDSFFSMGSPAIDGNILVAGGNFGIVYGFDISKGKIAWTTTPDYAFLGSDDCPPAIANGTAYINMDWFPTHTGVVNPVTGDDLLWQQKMYALDTHTGKIKWIFSEGSGPTVDDNQAGMPVVVDGVVYQTSPIGHTLSAVNATTGVGIWQINTGAISKGAPVIFGNYVIIGNAKGELTSYNKQTGALVTKKQLTGKINPTGPMLYNGTIYVGTQSGFLYAIPAATMFKQDAPAQPKAGRDFYPQTGHTLGGIFRDYWNAHGGLAQFGYPLTEEIQQFDKQSGNTYTVQYFERNRLEYHPEAPAQYQVLLGLLGNDLTAKRHGEQPFMGVAPIVGNVTYFPLTQHTLQGDFLNYWNNNGGLAIYGYPISEEFQEVNPADGKTYTVQYFERARFEKHPEAPPQYRVLLGLLGKQQMTLHWTIPTLVAHPAMPAMSH